jgi:catechol 2,3-dioxygenase-like lactoylglutathione lyase family enzyme
MQRLHVHIGVQDLDTNIRFYTSLFGAEPTMVKDDYAKWMLDDPRVNFAISTHSGKVGLDHVGIQAESADELNDIETRLNAAGIAGEAQVGTACCYARSDKYWTLDPQGIAWESFLTLGSAPTFNEAPEEQSASGCCVPSIGNEGCCG